MDGVSRKRDVCVQTLELTDSSDHSAVVLACRRLSGIQKSQDCCSVSVVFPGLVTQEGCCRFITCELLKQCLYQRQQLPLPYDQLVYFCRRQCQQQADGVFKRKMQRTDLADSKKCQRVLAELEELFGHLEAAFSLTLVPRVLLLLGGSTVCPRELYEVNMEGIRLGNAGQSLETSSCTRKIFHSVFLADVFSELKSPAIMGAVLLLQGHRDSAIDWFRPKLAYKVPSHGRRLTVNLSCCDVSLAPTVQEAASSAAQDYIWFQAPVTVKGFNN
ncbi:LOW QUALITY PROTEIN: MAD2L1-binding protein [Rhinatrema bivittatum]|uniref:LOW QUALITY PROTEIN: MAD2L1-binding protein n=1 Tax=Rhinatrema bivittatum TaxID=194408 RepID=UPI00112ABB8B|nr:LOW QUALITY PROTEIN: MAD2L1-binding protein [Rhinatrema bivittatum]